MRPEDLARELGIDGKRLRGWLRSRWPRAPEEHGLAWYLTPEQVTEVRRAFAGARSRSSPPVVVQRSAPVAPRPVATPASPSSSRLSWANLQTHADAVLASGLKDLTAHGAAPWGPVPLHGPGVYAFADGAVVAYVGESTSVSWRVGQHRDPGSRFLLDLGAAGIGDPAARIGIRSLSVDVGRIELEEFAIACLQPSLNRMRRLSRAALAYEDATPDLWRAVQTDAVRLLRAGVNVGLETPPVPWGRTQPPRSAGLYILRDANGRPLYVGESDALAERLRTHGGLRSYFSALRRHVGTEVLGLAFAPNVRRGFSPLDEAAISAYLATCSIAILPIAFGRWELERELVHELRPTLNREHSGSR